MLSPVTGAWLIALWPVVTTPSSGTRSPGRTRTTASSATELAGDVFQLPSTWRTAASSGASASKPLIAWRARSTERASISSAMA
jgi:hypothetical protein